MRKLRDPPRNTRVHGYYSGVCAALIVPDATLPMNGTIPDRVRELVQTRPEAVFCTFLAAGQSETIAFADLYKHSLAYAARYMQLGVNRGDLVIIILEHTPHLFYSYVGAILAGAIPSFMPFPSPKQRPDLYWADHEALFERIQPRLLVTYRSNLDAARAALPSFACPTLIADDAILTATGGSARLPAAFVPDDVACLQHSSGTTSLKKGVMLTHRAILAEVAAYARSIDFGPGDSIASWLPLYHDMGFIACFMTSILLGTHLVAIDPFEWVMRPQMLFDAIERYRTSFCWLPNFAFSHLVNATRKTQQWDLSSMRAFINCSEPCKPATFERFARRFAASGVTPEKLHVCYAMAENVFAVTQTKLGTIARTLQADADEFALGSIAPARAEDLSVSLLSCGAPLADVEIAIRDDSGAPEPDNRIGEVCLRSPFMFEGYYKLPETTRERLRNGWYHSGDMGFTHDGELYVTGRKDDMLIVNGRNYYAHEIERIVNTVNGVAVGRNVAIGVEERLTDATVVVVLAECKPDADPQSIALEARRLVLETLGVSIHTLIPLPAGGLVKTTSGKISRTKNKALYLQGAFDGRGDADGR